MHYEVTVESGKYEMVIRTTKCYSVGERIGMKLEPDGIHIMLAEDHTTSFVTNINSFYTQVDFIGYVVSGLYEFATIKKFIISAVLMALSMIAYIVSSYSGFQKCTCKDETKA